MKFIVSVAFVLFGTTLAANEARSVTWSSASVQAMEKVFDRSEQTHKASMNAMMTTMTLTKAVRILQKSKLNNKEVAQVTSMIHRQRHNLRKQPKGYSGIDGARKMLNEMIFESMSKYDQEIAKCTGYYSEQCAAMEVCRGQIAGANYIAANSRALILDSQATINKCEVDIPEAKQNLKEHNEKCKVELKKMNDRLKIVMGDIAVMTTILQMTECKTSLTQFDLVRCTDKCTKKSFIQFRNQDLQRNLDKLQSELSHDLVSDTFKDMFEGLKEFVGLNFLQTGADQDPPANKTEFNNPPLPRTDVPENPCNDPDMGAPSAADKAAAKCTIKKSPQCEKLQERFLLIQSGIEDERDQLLENNCEEIRNTLEKQIQKDQKILDNAQTKLAQATEKEADAGEVARTTAKEHDSLNDDLKKQMKSCSQNYINFETELCALKKIRGELYKMKGGGHSAFFQDCEVSTWTPDECSAACNGGDQLLKREVVAHPNGGAACLPLQADRKCNQHPCPVDCVLHTWSGWSKCSAECGGGVEQRLREVKMAAKYGGKPCGSTSETRSCHIDGCEADCELSEWTMWGACSKDCDGGTRKREKFVKKPALGDGSCPDQWDPQRLEYEPCNVHRCKTEEDKPLPCNKSLDVVLLLDGSGSLGKQGWNAEIDAAMMIVDAFKVSNNDDGESKAEVAIILYSGPSGSYKKVKKCTGRNTASVNVEEECKIKIVSHFTNNMNRAKQKILNLE